MKVYSVERYCKEFGCDREDFEVNDAKVYFSDDNDDCIGVETSDGMYKVENWRGTMFVNYNEMIEMVKGDC